MARVEIRGLDKLIADLNTLPDQIQKKVLKDALKKGAEPLMSEAKAQCPVVTGALRDSLRIKAGKSKKGRVSYMVTTSEGDFQGPTYYGGMVEYGTKFRPPNAFMLRAADLRGEEAIDTAMDAMSEGIDRELRG